MKKSRVCVNVKIISLVVLIWALMSTQAIASYIIDFSGYLSKDVSNHYTGQTTLVRTYDTPFLGTLTFNDAFVITTHNSDQQIGSTTAYGSITSDGTTLSIDGTASVNVYRGTTFPNSYGITINQFFGTTAKTVSMIFSSDKANPFLPNLDLIQPTAVLQAALTKTFYWQEVTRDNGVPVESYYFGNTIDNVTTHSSSVPEPATMLLLGIGLIGLAGVRRKFKN